MNVTLTIDDLRKAVDLDKVTKILQQFDGDANIKALTTLSAALGVLLGSECYSAESLLAATAAAQFIIHDAAQAAMKEHKSIVMKTEPTPVTLN